MTPGLILALGVGSWAVVIALTMGVLAAVTYAVALSPISGALAAVVCFYAIRSAVAWCHLRLVGALGTRGSPEKIAQIRSLDRVASIVLLPASAGDICESRWPGMGPRYILITESLITSEKLPRCLLHQLGHLQQAGHGQRVLVLIMSAAVLLPVASNLTSTAHWLARAFALGLAVVLAEAASALVVSRRREHQADVWVRQQEEHGSARDQPATSTAGGPAYHLCRSDGA